MALDPICRNALPGEFVDLADLVEGLSWLYGRHQ
jgi:hypothetical protein